MSDNKLSEKLLLYRLTAKQDPEAFAKLYDIYVRRIYRFVYFKVSRHEEAEDITSEVFLKAWHYISEKKKIESFSGLLYRLARNGVVDMYRARSKQNEKEISVEEYLALDMDMAGAKGLAEAVGDKIETEKILNALKKLKHEYREVTTLRFVDELEIKEIAQIVNKGSVATRVLLHRALKKLKEILNEQ